MNKDSGVIIAIGEITSGTTKDLKDWRKQDVVVEWGQKFKEKLCVTAFNDKVDQLSRLNVGDKVTVEYNVNSRPWIGNDGVTKWFHNVNLFKIDLEVDNGNEVFKPEASFDGNDYNEGEPLPF